MISFTFKTREQYVKFVKDMSLFTLHRAYNANAYLWKEEDIEHVTKISDSFRYSDSMTEEERAEWKKSTKIYFKALEEYGEARSYWDELFSGYSFDSFVHHLGFNFGENNNDDEEISIEEMLDIDFNNLPTNKNFPKEFPCVMAYESDMDQKGIPNVLFIYPDDFKKELEEEHHKIDLDWFRENIKRFWTKGEGHGYD